MESRADRRTSHALHTVTTHDHASDRPGYFIGELRLSTHPALYVNHLAIAQRLEQWGEGLVGAEGFQAGFKDALLDVAAHLRQADYLPGSPELDL